ncbi:MAG: hypothetical protein AAGH15_15320 [Myxococcota bacterium]
MPQLTVGQKADRVLRFLLSLQSTRITGPLIRYGFQAEDLEEGWARLRALAIVRLDRVPPSEGLPAAVGELDAWENRWFPIVKATLGRHHPAANDAVFRNLPQTTGPKVVLGVSRFIERVRGLPENQELGPEEGNAARALLARRGLTDDVLDDAEVLVRSLDDLLEPREDDEADFAEELRAAEDAMWTWYLEWSAIARAVIRDRRLLRSMGFLRYRKKGEPPEVVGLEEPMAEPGTVTLPRQQPVAGLLRVGDEEAPGPNDAS